jgi:hypothetical protein
MHANASKCINLGAVQTLTAQAAGTVATGNLDTQQAKGCILLINVTAVTGSLTVSLKGVDPTSGASYTVLASAAISATGLTVLRVYPGLTASANATANDVLPNTCVISSVVATGPATATVTMQLIY